MIQRSGVIFVFAILIGCFVTQSYGAKVDNAPVVLATLIFKTDSATINPKSENDLKQIQTALEADPAMGLRIVGYGGSQKNRQAAQKRVQAVQQWFLKQGIAKSRLKAKTLIDRKPPVQKKNAEDAMHAERVEILQISLKQPLAVLPAPVYKFDSVVEGQEVSHAFIVQNKGSAPLKIQRVKTDWGCTAASYTRQIPPGGEGNVTLKVNTLNKGGHSISKHATLFTNDEKNPRLKLTISGSVDKFVTIKPNRVKLRGVAGEEIKSKVTITPKKKYPFKIVKVSAKDGKDIHFELSEEKGKQGPVYALLIENKRSDVGRYFDMITVETDSKIQPKLSIRVYGDLRQRAKEEKKQTQ